MGSIISTSSCVNTTTISFLCNENDAQIFVNDNYIGKGLATYTFPKEIATAEVICKQDGKVTYAQSFHIKGQNKRLIEINIPNNQFYSLDRHNHSK